MPDWDRLRLSFPATESVTYLDMARKALPPTQAATAAADWFADIGSPAAGGHAFSMENAETTRTAVAQAFGAPPETLALVKNTSEGVNIVAHGISWKAGENVVISGAEHENNTFPWRPLARQGVEIRVVPERPSGLVEVDDLIAAMDGRTRVLSVAWVTYGIGQRMDLDLLAQACRDRDVILLVDGIQAVGILNRRLDSLGAHVVAAGGHKAQLSVAGAGLMYISPEVLDRIHPVFMAKFSFDTLDRRVDNPGMAPGARRFEYGNPNFLGLAIQGQSARMVEDIGLDAIESCVRHLTNMLFEGVRSLPVTLRTPEPWDQRAAIVSLDLASVSADWMEATLANEGIRVASKDGHLRISPHFYNNETDIRHFLERLQFHLERTRP